MRHSVLYCADPAKVALELGGVVGLSGPEGRGKLCLDEPHLLVVIEHSMDAVGRLAE